MNSTNDVSVECGAFEAHHSTFLLKICEKLHEIACKLTRLTRRTLPADRATPHIQMVIDVDSSYAFVRSICYPNILLFAMEGFGGQINR